MTFDDLFGAIGIATLPAQLAEVGPAKVQAILGDGSDVAVGDASIPGTTWRRWCHLSA
jgi:hypothetical protein